MDPLFVADPGDDAIRAAIGLWPELAGRRLRPLLVSAFGDIFLETEVGDVWVASPVDLACDPVAASAGELERLLGEPAWAGPRLLTDVALLARDHGVVRPQHQVFAIAPHPCFTDSITVEALMPVDLVVWHHLAAQIRGARPTLEA